MPERTAIGRFELILLGVAVTGFGMAYGATAVSAGIPPVRAMALSVLAHAGTAQLGALAVLSSGGTPVTAYLTGMLIMARFIPIGLVVAPRLWPGLTGRLLATHILVEPGAALALAADDVDHARSNYLRVGTTLLTVWIIGSAIGVYGGQLISDIRVLGLDAALPALLVGVVVPMLRDSDMRLAALTATAVALVLVPVLPAGAPVLAGAASGFAVAHVVRRRPRGSVRGGSAA